MKLSLKQLRKVRRAAKGKYRRNELAVPYHLRVHRTCKHIYAQIFMEAGAKVVACASTLDKEFDLPKTSNISAAAKVGELVAIRAKKIGIEKVAFDRAGYRYHGKIKALADAARENGLVF